MFGVTSDLPPSVGIQPPMAEKFAGFNKKTNLFSLSFPIENKYDREFRDFLSSFELSEEDKKVGRQLLEEDPKRPDISINIENSVNMDNSVNMENSINMDNSNINRNGVGRSKKVETYDLVGLVDLVDSSDDDNMDKLVKVEQYEIDTVIQHTGATRKQAIAALLSKKNIVDAILALTP